MFSSLELQCTRLLPVVALSTCLGVSDLSAQTPAPAAYAPDSLTADDYRHAESLLGSSLGAAMVSGSIRPTWISDNSFWYRGRTERGWEFLRVDAERRRKTPAFDQEALARALSAATRFQIDPYNLPFGSFEYAEGGIRFSLQRQLWFCPTEGPCREDRTSVPPNSIVSPDGRRAAFIRDHNLWVRELSDGSERALTSDGVEDFGYATNNAGWVRSDRPVLAWSPDSKKIATFQHDARGVGEMYLVSTGVGHPELDRWKYPLPEDSVVFRIQRVVLHVDDGRVVRLQIPPDVHRSTICDHISCGGEFSDVEWTPDSEELAFVSSTRDHKEARLRMADPETGAVREVLMERVETFFESGNDMVNWHVLPESNEVLWYSQRDDWGHLYLYDLASGRLKRQVTSGDWNVLQVRHIDHDQRQVYFTGAGREPGDPYFEYFYRVGLDDGRVSLLSPDSLHHDIATSPTGRWFVDSGSTPVDPGRVVLRDARGRERMVLERPSSAALLAAGWKPPIPFTVKARDGVTDLYGLMYTPSTLDPAKKYPVVNYIYPGPQTGSVGSRTFNSARRDHQALAELGFIVVELDAMGTPMRSKSFHTAYYGNMGDNGLPDQVAGIRQLATDRPWMDLDRVGIWGHSGGGFASTAGILRFPDFYKVAVSQAGNHDNRNYEDDWGEKWQGLLKTLSDSTTSYDNQANQLLAGNLKGKLLLAHGTMDDNVPPSNTLVVADALIAANKDFDLIMMTNRRHGFAMEPYMMRRRWDYFVKHLLGAEPPKEFEFGRRPVS
ncbi:MAG: DPP IV N-terminal domain-containing protein [Gemmatimonadota bacterium]